MSRKKRETVIANIDQEDRSLSANANLQNDTDTISLSVKLSEETTRIASNGNITIKSAHLVEGMFCHFTYEESFIRDNAVVSNSVTKKSGLPMHDDLWMAFAFLPLHLAVICEELSADEISDEEIETMEFPKVEGNPLFDVYQRYRVEKFAMKGTGEGEGVVLMGYKRLTTGDEVQLVTPKIKWNSNYQFVNELRGAIKNCIDEVQQYHNGKKAPDIQGDLFNQEEEDVTEEYTR